VHGGRRQKERAGGRLIAVAVVSLLAVMLGACASTPRYGPVGSAQGDLARAQDEYARGHYLTVIELLETFERRHAGSQYVDDALFLLGKAHQANREQILARQTLQRVRDEYPQGPFAEEALFEIARSWFMSIRGPALDAEPAEEALRSFRLYLRRYPDGEFAPEAREGERETLEILAAKSYLNGRTYMRIGRPQAARQYFEKSLAWREASEYAALAWAGIARSHEEEGQAAAARAAYVRLHALLESGAEAFKDGPELLRKARRKLEALPAPAQPAAPVPAADAGD